MAREARTGQPAGDDLRLPAAVVTGEAVPLDVALASPASRALALALDMAIQLALAIGLLFLLIYALRDADSDAVGAVSLLAGVAVVVGVPATWETASRGRSPGKAAAGLRVVRDDGGPIRARHALVRSLVSVAEIWLLSGGPALICSLLSRQSKRIGDLLAGTIVVRERAGGATVPPPQMPPALADWAASADIGAIGEDVAVAARTVLARSARLDDASRARLLSQLSARIAPVVAPQPPRGTSAEQFLAAVLAERREREQRHWQQVRQRRDAMAGTWLALQEGRPADRPSPVTRPPDAAR